MKAACLPSPLHACAALGIALLLAACTGAPQARPQPPAQHAGVNERQVDAPVRALSGTPFEQAVRESRARLVFAYVPATGFAHRQGTAPPGGATVELLRDFARWVADTHGIAVDVAWYAEPSWSTFYARVRDARGGVFGVGNVTITDARREELDFSPPYMSNIATLVTHASVPELGSMDAIASEFSGLAGLVFPGTLHEARLQAMARSGFPGLRMRAVASNDELIDLLASGQGYFGYVDIYNFWRAEQAGRPLRRHPVGDDGSEEFGVILPVGSDWTPVMQAFFEAGGGYVRGAQWREHMRRNLGEGLADMLLGG